MSYIAAAASDLLAAAPRQDLPAVPSATTIPRRSRIAHRVRHPLATSIAGRLSLFVSAKSASFRAQLSMPSLNECREDIPFPSRRPSPWLLSPARIQASLDEHNGALELTWKVLGLPSRHALRRLIQKHRLVIRKRPRPKARTSADP
jgi:hypothetical protein